MKSNTKANRRPSGAPTIAAVAERAGVSPMTVSRVINGEKNVRQANRDVVESAIAELGYSPNQAARSLAGAGLVQIGVLYHDASSPYISAFLVGGLEQSSRRNVQLVIEQCNSPSAAEAALSRFGEGSIDGVILPPPLSDSTTAIELAEQLDIPTVLIATERPRKQCSGVGIDDYLAARAMVEHLVSLGHERIGFIMGNPKQDSSGRRLSGFRDALAESGLTVDETLIVPGLYTYRSGMDAAETLLSREVLPTAIFASNDDMAAATVSVAHRHGIDVPGDLTVCGFDDTAIAVTVWPELTTIHQPVVDMSRAAVDLLIEEIRARRNGERKPTQRVVLDFSLIRRQSDAAPRRLSGRQRGPL